MHRNVWCGSSCKFPCASHDLRKLFHSYGGRVVEAFSLEAIAGESPSAPVAKPKAAPNQSESSSGETAVVG